MAGKIGWLVRITIGAFCSLIVHIVIQLGIFNSPSETLEYNSCSHLEKKGIHTRGPEDILVYNQTYLIVSSNDNFKLWEIGTFQDAPEGSILLIKNYQTNPELNQFKLIGFPSNVRFHPHGAYIRKEDDTFFVINHSYISGNGDRVEVFKLNLTEQTLTYKNSILFPLEFAGVLNNLIVTQKGKMYITKYMASEDPLTGRQTKSKLLQLEFIYHVIFQIKQTHAYMCTFDENWANNKTPIIPSCTIQKQTNSIMANGITWDGKDTVYIADTTSRSVKRYKLGRQELEFNGELALSFSPDNVEFDAQTGRISTAGPIRPIDHISFCEAGKKIQAQVEKIDEFWCGVGYIDAKTFTFKEVARLKNSSVGCASAYTQDSKIIIGSWVDKALLICDQK